MELSDEMIMQRVKEGKLSEMTWLFERYHVKLYNFFLKLTFDKIISQDLTQNLFYRIIKYRHTYKNDNGSFRTWIYQLARNVHIDFCKQERKLTDHFKNVASYNNDCEENKEIYEEGDFENLDRALMKLNPDQRELIILSRFQGLKYEEISKIKEISVPAIKVQIHRAIKQLKDIYFKQLERK